MTFIIHNGDSAEVLKQYPDNHFDSVVCDPPYGIAFLGKDWDKKKASKTTSDLVAVQNLPSGTRHHTSLADDLEFQFWMTSIFSECLRVLKPGGHLLAFSAARTYHHMAMAAQMSGFEIRDQLMWIYSSGFPKSQNVGKSIQRSLGVKETKQLESNGPANGLARMTFNQSNPAKFNDTKIASDTVCTDPEAKAWEGWGTALKPAQEPIVMARKPVKGSIVKNVQEHGTGALHIDACRVPTDDVIVSTKAVGMSLNPENNVDGPGTGHKVNKGLEKWEQNDKGRFPSNVLGVVEGYQKYFYQPKVSRKERHIGFANTSTGNDHPTVKPVALMSYLVRLVTPPDGTVLDPFCGSGSTGMAAVENGFNFVGIEQDPDYVKIANTRIKAWAEYTADQKEQKNPANYTNLFDIE